MNLFEDILSFNNKGTKKILVVEDNELDSSQIAKMLQDDNMQVTIATTGKKALEEMDSRMIMIVLFWIIPCRIFPGSTWLTKLVNTKKN